MKRLPMVKFNIDVTTVDDRFVADVSLAHRAGGRTLKAQYEAKSLKRLASTQTKVLVEMLTALMRNDT